MPNSGNSVSVNGHGERRPHPQATRFAQEGKELNRDFVEPPLEDWNKQSPEVLKKNHKLTAREVSSILEGYKADLIWADESFKSSDQSHKMWRLWMILATGLLAAVNFALVALIQYNPYSEALFVVASLYGTCLAVVANVERFLDKAGEASKWRERRELFLNQFREYSSKWLLDVDALGKTPAAYRNARRLYRELIDSDQVLRQKLKQMDRVDDKESDSLNNWISSTAKKAQSKTAN
jgi:hypothetical protein